jgi:hypothetical protein
MKSIFILTFLLGLTSMACAQKSFESYEIDGRHYYLDGKLLKNRQFRDLMKNDPAAHKEFRRAQAYRWVGHTFCLVSLGFVGIKYVQITDDYQNYFPSIIMGIVSAATSIPFYSRYLFSKKRAAYLFERSLKRTSLDKTELKIGLCQQGVALAIRF